MSNHPPHERHWWQRLLPERSGSNGSHSYGNEDWADLGTGFGLEGSLSSDKTDHGWLHPTGTSELSDPSHRSDPR